jgi:hypothetical protein
MRIPVVWSGNRQSGGGSQSSGETQQASQNNVPWRIGRTRAASDCPIPPGSPDGGHPAFDASPPTRGRFPLRNQRVGHRSQETWVVLILPQNTRQRSPPRRTGAIHPLGRPNGATNPYPYGATHPYLNGATHRTACSARLVPSTQFELSNGATYPYLNGATHRTACSAQSVPSTQFELSNGATHSLTHVERVAPLNAAIH